MVHDKGTKFPNRRKPGGSPLARFGDKSNNGSSGYRAYLRSSNCWCYRCNAPHLWAEPCVERP